MANKRLVDRLNETLDKINESDDNSIGRPSLTDGQVVALGKLCGSQKIALSGFDANSQLLRNFTCKTELFKLAQEYTKKANALDKEYKDKLRQIVWESTNK